MKKYRPLFLSAFVMVIVIASQVSWGASRLEQGRTGVIMEVYNPTGAVQVKLLHAPRMRELENMTICELSDHMWESHRTFPVLRELLNRRFPKATVVPYNELPNAYGVDSASLEKMIREKGCDGVIVGNAA